MLGVVLWAVDVIVRKTIFHLHRAYSKETLPMQDDVRMGKCRELRQDRCGVSHPLWRAGACLPEEVFYKASKAMT